MFDSYYLLLVLIGLPLVFIPQWLVKRTYEKYVQVKSQFNRTGAQVAEDILRREGLSHVQVEMTPGELSDHYDPSTRTVRLSPQNYQGASVAAVAIAAHEVGHAIQHARGFFPVVLRSAMVPVVNFGSQLGPILIMASIMLTAFQILAPDLSLFIGLCGVLFFGLAVAFHIVTLPVEFDASLRAVGILQSSSFLSHQELPMAKKVLTAAAFTYVATALYSLMQLMYYLHLILGRQRN